MKILKTVLIFLIGIGVLIMAIMFFAQSQKTTSLESGTLKHWPSASVDRRIAAVKILTATDKDNEIVVQCVDKMTTLPDSDTMPVRDAVNLCFAGMQIKNQI